MSEKQGRGAQGADVLGPVLFVAGSFIALLTLMALFKGLPAEGAGGTGGLARGVVLTFGAVPALLVSLAVAGLGVRAFLTGRLDNVGRDLSGAFGTGAGLAILLGCFSATAGGGLGAATGGTLAGWVTSIPAAIVGLAAFLAPIWLTWLRDSGLFPVRNRPLRSLTAELGLGSSAELDLDSGVTLEEADALLPELQSPTETDTEDDATETEAADDEPTAAPLEEPQANDPFAAMAPEWELPAQPANPYPEDVRLRGEVPEGATPILSDEPTPPRTAAADDEPESSVYRWTPERDDLHGDAADDDLAAAGLRPEALDAPVDEGVDERTTRASAAGVAEPPVVPGGASAIETVEGPRPTWERASSADLLEAEAPEPEAPTVELTDASDDDGWERSALDEAEPPVAAPVVQAQVVERDADLAEVEAELEAEMAAAEEGDDAVAAAEPVEAIAEPDVAEPDVAEDDSVEDDSVEDDSVEEAPLEDATDAAELAETTEEELEDGAEADAAELEEVAEEAADEEAEDEAEADAAELEEEWDDEAAEEEAEDAEEADAAELEEEWDDEAAEEEAEDGEEADAAELEEEWDEEAAEDEAEDGEEADAAELEEEWDEEAAEDEVEEEDAPELVAAAEGEDDEEGDEDEEYEYIEVVEGEEDVAEDDGEWEYVYVDEDGEEVEVDDEEAEELVAEAEDPDAEEEEAEELVAEAEDPDAEEELDESEALVAEAEEAPAAELAADATEESEDERYEREFEEMLAQEDTAEADPVVASEAPEDAAEEAAPAEPVAAAEPAPTRAKGKGKAKTEAPEPEATSASASDDLADEVQMDLFAAPEEAQAAAEAEPIVELEPQPRRTLEPTAEAQKAAELILAESRVAVSMLQKTMGLDFKSSCTILDELQELGFIGPYIDGKQRDILMSREEWLAAVGVEE